MMRNTLFSVAAIALGAASTAVVARTPDLAYAYDFATGSRQVVKFPVGAPGSMTVVGPQADSLNGLDFDPAGSVLWALNLTHQTVGTVDKETGAYTPVATVQAGFVNALTIDPVAGTFLVSKLDEYVYSLDPQTGETILLAQGAPAQTQITALAMDCSARLFAMAADGNGSHLYQVNMDAGPALIGTPQYSGATTLEFDNDAGDLYGWFNSSGNDFSTYGSVDPATAVVANTSLLAGKYRMAIRNTCFRIFTDDFES